MSTKDHNNTLVMLYAAIACFYSFGILAAPWIIEKNLSWILWLDEVLSDGCQWSSTAPMCVLILD